MRVLKPGGFFCYADLYCASKNQTNKLESFIRDHKNASIILRKNLTKSVQRSIYNRIIVHEKEFLEKAYLHFENNILEQELVALAHAQGLSFLPKWWIRFRNPFLKRLANTIKKQPYWAAKKYFFLLPYPKRCLMKLSKLKRVPVLPCDEKKQLII